MENLRVPMDNDSHHNFFHTTIDGTYDRASIMKITTHRPITSQQRCNTNPLELFVGNLSYFCTEEDLYELFNQFVNVTSVRVMRADDKKRS